LVDWPEAPSCGGGFRLSHLVVLHQLNHPSQVQGSLLLGEIINQFFGGNAHRIGELSYRDAENRVNGGKYIQAGYYEVT
jgi:hypothetical protein